ncbi:hypothetical protein AMECASPLE_025377 [Ameca splendens]|uniref:Uncharacterized protein n=1 Tax=Ameca splendens TaxID=208324 RepID=A0ABV0ZG02_9TELE
MVTANKKEVELSARWLHQMAAHRCLLLLEISDCYLELFLSTVTTCMLIMRDCCKVDAMQFIVHYCHI